MLFQEIFSGCEKVKKSHDQTAPLMTGWSETFWSAHALISSLNKNEKGLKILSGIPSEWLLNSLDPDQARQIFANFPIYTFNQVGITRNSAASLCRGFP